MKRAATTTLLVGWIAAAPAMAGGDANLFLGGRSTSDDTIDAAGLDTVPQYGAWVTLDFEWPVALALDLMWASDDASVTLSGAFPTTFDTEVDTLELDIGVRKVWGEKLRPYVGGGVAWVDLGAKQTETTSFGGPPVTDLIIDDSGSSVGFWVDGGFLYVLGTSLNIGVDVRYTDADVDLTPEGSVGKINLDSGGTQYGFLIGYHW
jgi:opacity protein-like surface antigen